jgi:hypothetical protein
VVCAEHASIPKDDMQRRPPPGDFPLFGSPTILSDLQARRRPTCIPEETPVSAWEIDDGTVGLEDVTILRETEVGMLYTGRFLIEYEGEQFWIGKSAIYWPDTEVRARGDHGTLALERKYAVRRGLYDD